MKNWKIQSENPLHTDYDDKENSRFFHKDNMEVWQVIREQKILVNVPQNDGKIPTYLFRKASIAFYLDLAFPSALQVTFEAGVRAYCFSRPSLASSNSLNGTPPPSV